MHHEPHKPYAAALRFCNDAVCPYGRHVCGIKRERSHTAALKMNFGFPQKWNPGPRPFDPVRTQRNYCTECAKSLSQLCNFAYFSSMSVQLPKCKH